MELSAHGNILDKFDCPTSGTLHFVYLWYIDFENVALVLNSGNLQTCKPKTSTSKKQTMNQEHKSKTNIYPYISKSKTNIYPYISKSKTNIYPYISKSKTNIYHYIYKSKTNIYPYISKSKTNIYPIYIQKQNKYIPIYIQKWILQAREFKLHGTRIEFVPNAIPASRTE